MRPTFNLLRAVLGRTDENVEPLLLGGTVDLAVVGESHYQVNLRRIVRNATGRIRTDITAVLLAETDNHYDPNAVAVWARNLAVGYLSREDARRYRPGLLALENQHGRAIALRGVVVGEEFLGVFLRHDPRDFGLDTRALPRAHTGNLRTGLSDALATDVADNSYDLSWLASLPLDTTQAIGRLRELLGEEREPIDRHFMFHELEAALYRSRHAVPTALNEFDDACRQHDSEMDALRPAFLAKWGRVPWIQTYRQMCIREAKAGNLVDALRWAERGIEIYGRDAARPEAIEDLKRRADEYRRRLQVESSAQPRPRLSLPRPKVQETLRCGRCDASFQRVRLSGRKPAFCPECRGGPAQN